MVELSRDEYAGTAEVAKSLGIHRSTVNRWADRGWVKSVMVGGKRLVNRASVEDFLNRGRPDPGPTGEVDARPT